MTEPRASIVTFLHRSVSAGLLSVIWLRKKLTRHIAIRDFSRRATGLRLSGAMVRASISHSIPRRFNPRRRKSVRQCSPMVTAPPDRAEPHPSKLSLAQAGASTPQHPRSW